MEYLSINLSKYVKDLYSENYKTLMKENKEDLNNSRHSMLMVGSINVIKMSVFPILICRFTVVPNKIPEGFF